MGMVDGKLKVTWCRGEGDGFRSWDGKEVVIACGCARGSPEHQECYGL